MHTMIFETQEAVPEGLRDAAEKDQSGKFVVSVVPKKKVDEFRETNIAMTKERDTYRGVFDKLKPFGLEDITKLDDFGNEIVQLRTTAKRVKDGELIENTSLEKAVELRIGEMKQTHENQVSTLNKAVTDLKAVNLDLGTKYNRTIIDRHVTEQVLSEKNGARPDALGAILREAYDVFTVNDKGQIIPKDANGGVIYGGDGATPMTAGEWIKKLPEKCPFYFKDSNGGGASGGNGRGGNSGADALAKIKDPVARLRAAREQSAA